MSNCTTIRRWWRVAVPGVFLAAVGAASAQDTTADAGASQAESNAAAVAEANSRSSITPQAQAVLDRMTASMNALQRYSVSADITRDEVRSFGYKMQHNETARMWVERPNRMRVEVDGDVKTRTYVYDGSKFTIYSGDDNVWSSTRAPATIGDVVAKLLAAGVEMPLIDMLYHGAAGSLTEQASVGIVVGESSIGGVMADHLAFRQTDLDWQLWVSQGARALPVKMVITTRYAVGDPQYSATLRWDADTRIDAKSFVFVPPSGATEVPMNGDLFETGEAK